MSWLQLRACGLCFRGHAPHPRAARMRHASSGAGGACRPRPRVTSVILPAGTPTPSWREWGPLPPDREVVEVRGGARRDPIRAVKKFVITTMAHSLVRRAISTRSTVTPQQQRVIAAFREAYAEASTTAGGAVYSGQDVRGLSDCAADHQLVAALQLCGSEETIQLGPPKDVFWRKAASSRLPLPWHSSRAWAMPSLICSQRRATSCWARLPSHRTDAHSIRSSTRVRSSS